MIFNLTNVLFAAPAAKQGFSIMQFVPFLVIIAIFYFLLIRPQKKQREKHNQFIAKLKTGDEVITSSGIVGNIKTITDKTVTLQIDDDTKIKILKSMVSMNAKDALSSNLEKK
jgi:preprotein translocase subunit YajC